MEKLSVNNNFQMGEKSYLCKLKRSKKYGKNNCIGHADYCNQTGNRGLYLSHGYAASKLRNRNTLEYIGIWEKVYNPDFNYGEFATIRNQAGLNRFKISVKEFVTRTNAICLQAKAGRYGGTYAHKDIAFEFAMWISPEFKIFIVKEFQRLKGRLTIISTPMLSVQILYPTKWMPIIVHLSMPKKLMC